jgi:hypothetical protein
MPVINNGLRNHALDTVGAACSPRCGRARDTN